jgi:hypothetical protein
MPASWLRQRRPICETTRGISTFGAARPSALNCSGFRNIAEAGTEARCVECAALALHRDDMPALKTADSALPLRGSSHTAKVSEQLARW